MRPEEPTKVERTPWREEDDDSSSSRSSNDDERVAAAFFIEKSDCKVYGPLIAIIHDVVSELPMILCGLPKREDIFFEVVS